MNLIDNIWKEKMNGVSKEQERKDFELISKTENILLKKYENIRNFDRAIKGIKGGIKLNSTRRPLYLKILNDLNNHNPRLISLDDVKYQILQTTKSFKKTNIPSGTDIKHVELRRINLHINTVIGGLHAEKKLSDIHQNDKKRREEVLGAVKGVIKDGEEMLSNMRQNYRERRERGEYFRGQTNEAVKKSEELLSNITQTPKENEKEKIEIETAIKNWDVTKLSKYFKPNEIPFLKEYLSRLIEGSNARQEFIDSIARQKAVSSTVDIEVIYKGLDKKAKTENSKKQIVQENTDVINSVDENAILEKLGTKKGGNNVENSEHLDERKVKLREYILSWSVQDTKIGSEGLTLKQVFLNQNESWLKSLKRITDKDLEKKYNEWDKSRLKDIKKILNYDDLYAYATRKQIEIAKFDKATTEGYEERMKNHPDFDKDGSDEAQNIRKFRNYTQGELIGELLMNAGTETEEGLKLLQVLSLSTARGSRLFDTSIITGDWNAETQYFLENAFKDPSFQKSDKTGEYSKKILEVLNSHPHLDTSYLDQDFQTLSEVQNREQEYIKNPDSFWQSQTVEGPRNFVGVSDLGYGNSYKLGEHEFLNSHMQGFNGKLAEFLNIPQFKEGVPIDETSRTRMEQIWNTIPLEQINGIYTQFASNPEEQEKFQDFLNENNLLSIDINDISLKNLVLNQNLSFNPIAKYCYERVWISCQNEIVSESGKTLQYLSDKTGDTALNIKNKVLEYFLPGISIRPEKAENGIFYFRDENNLDTLYSFNPENGEISQQGNISLEDEGIISFRSWGSKGNLLQKIQGFQNIVDFDLLDVLPDKNPKNMEELENEILNKIQSKIAVEKVADTSVVTKELLKLKNERNVCQNSIVGDLKQLLNIEDNYLYETSGENYKIFYNLLKTFERINIEYPNDNKPLISMKLLLDKICDNTSSFTLLKPSLLENNGDPAEESPQENTNGEIQNQQKIARGPHIIKNLINPNTQLFDLNLINDLANNSEFDQHLAERKYDRVIAEIQKNRELKIAKQDYEKEIAKLYSDTRDELHGLNEDVELFANISSLENEGDFLS